MLKVVSFFEEGAINIYSLAECIYTAEKPTKINARPLHILISL